MKLLLTLATIAARTVSAFAGDKVVLEHPLIVAMTKDEAKNLDQMLKDGDKEGIKAEHASGMLALVNPVSDFSEASRITPKHVRKRLTCAGEGDT